MNRLTSYILSALLLTIFPVSADELAAGFVNPPNSAKPWVYWVWFAGGGVGRNTSPLKATHAPVRCMPSLAFPRFG